MTILKLRELYEASTEGEWFMHDFTDSSINPSPSAQDITVSCTHPDHITVASMHGGFHGHSSIEQAKKDALFIVYAKRHMKELLNAHAEVEQLKTHFKGQLALAQNEADRTGKEIMCNGFRIEPFKDVDNYF